MVYLYNGILFNNKKLLIYASLWMNLKNIIKVREVRGKNHTLYTSVYTKCPEKANLEKQKVEMVTDCTWGCE